MPIRHASGGGDIQEDIKTGVQVEVGAVVINPSAITFQMEFKAMILDEILRK